MASKTFNVAKGSLRYYAGLPGTNDAFLVIPCSAFETDATLVDRATMSTVLSNGTTEQTTLGRKTVTSVTITQNDTSDTVKISIADQTWTAASGTAVVGVIIAYDPDTTGGTDSSVVPLLKLDGALTPDGNDASTVFDATNGLVTIS